ncbi:hypothetical protein C8J56DRAFT_1026964 [Mycena floridula]|nr:hypothetical protein C8J56DRAFT_1026964 [Mycena floridula]
MLSAKFILAAFSAFITVSAAPGAGALRRQSESLVVGRSSRTAEDRHTPRRVGSLYPGPRRISLPRAAQDWQTPHDAGFGMPGRRRRSAYPAPRIGIPTIASAFVVPSQMVYPLTDPTRLDLAPAYSATCETGESIPKLNREREQEALAQ